jgi:hypothetical protein
VPLAYAFDRGENEDGDFTEVLGYQKWNGKWGLHYHYLVEGIDEHEFEPKPLAEWSRDLKRRVLPHLAHFVANAVDQLRAQLVAAKEQVEAASLLLGKLEEADQ